ncbi:hypothetical protein Rhal01_01379 [Rubritalea halochordaticola]|uniref:Sulfotransferase family protein n=1 Tax=Rubritalea halochordaticola TaxID=714537 RepID=A0ABP9UZU1_9BACT
MISHKYKCIFIHIPKCAGTSVEQALGHIGDYKGRDEQDHRSLRMIEKPVDIQVMLSSKENVGHYLKGVYYKYKAPGNPNNKLVVNHLQYEDYYKFSFVRNPWHRAYSAYSNVIRDSFHMKKYQVDEDITFRDFLKRFMGVGFLREQLYWLKDYRGNLPYDFIGRFENLTDDFAKVTSDLGCDNLMLPHKIKGNNVSFQTAFDDESIELIAEFYKEEIELFGYSFD